MNRFRLGLQRNLVIFTAGLSIVVMMFAGCQARTEMGGPGAVQNTPTNPSNTFTLTLPLTEIEIAQGETQEFKLGIARGSEFSQPVAITFASVDMGLTVEPSTTTMTSADKEVTVKLTAAEDAQTGKVSITLIGEPTSGKAVDGVIHVRVTERQ